MTKPTPFENIVARRVGLGLWMEPQGAAYTLEVTGDGVFEVWHNWGGVWQLATKTGGAPHTFGAGADLRQVVVLCREKGDARLELRYANTQNPKYNGVYGANLMLHGYDVLAIDSDNTNGYGILCREKGNARLELR